MTKEPLSSMEHITSIKDARVQSARKLSSAAGRSASGFCQLQGEEHIRWGLLAHLPIEYVFIHSKETEHPLVEILQKNGIPCLSVSEGVLKKISDTHYIIPMIGIARINERSFASTHPFILVLDGIQDHGNIGSIIRTAHGFGIHNLVATQADFDMYYKKIIDASRGTVFETNIKKTKSSGQAVDFLKEQGYQIVTTSPHAPHIQSLTNLKDKPLALVIGNETSGVSDDLFQAADILVQIPMSSDLESLNVSVAAGISIYEFKYKMVMAMLIHNIRSTLGREINVTGKLIQQVLDRNLQGVSTLNSTQLILMMVMKCDQKMTLEQISKDTACHGDELLALLKPLLDSGFIYHHQGAVDEPDTYTLSEKGEDLLGKLWNIVESSEVSLLQGFSVDEIERFKEYIRRLRENAESLIG